VGFRFERMKREIFSVVSGDFTLYFYTKLRQTINGVRHWASPPSIPIVAAKASTDARVAGTRALSFSCRIFIHLTLFLCLLSFAPPFPPYSNSVSAKLVIIAFLPSLNIFRLKVGSPSSTKGAQLLLPNCPP
jgi:hypothetical protein